MTATETLQPYAAAYMAAHPARVFAGHQFIPWISGQWREWGEETGTDLDRPRTPAQRDAFGAWLAERWTEGDA